MSEICLAVAILFLLINSYVQWRNLELQMEMIKNLGEAGAGLSKRTAETFELVAESLEEQWRRLRNLEKALDRLEANG